MRSNIARTCPACSFPACLPSDVEGAPRGAPARWRAGMGRLLAQREEIDDRCELLRWQVLERGHRRRRVHERASDPLPRQSRGDVREVRPRSGVAVVADLVACKAARLRHHLLAGFVFGERAATGVVFRDHAKTLVIGVLICLATFVLFYLMTVFALSWGTSALGYSREKFLLMQLVDIAFFAVTIPISAVLAERGRRSALLWVTVAIGVFGLLFAPLFAAGTTQAMIMMALGLAPMGMTYGPLGTVLSELFPTTVRYTGSSLAFNFAGIFGASLAPYIATWLAKNYGLQYVGYYLSTAALISLCGLLMMRETKDDDLTASNL